MLWSRLPSPGVCPAFSLLPCTSAALVTSTGNTPPVLEEPCEAGAGLRGRQGQSAVGQLSVLWVDLAWKCEVDNPGFPGNLWKNLHLQIGNSLVLDDVL